MDWTIVQGGFCGQVGFPLLLNKAIWIWAFYKLHFFEEGMFKVGKWAFPCCRTKH